MALFSISSDLKSAAAPVTFGLRWLELTHGWRFDLRGSLVPQLALALLDGETGDGRADT